jgi:tetratricopeptide (TPR) repeat protein
MYMIRFSISTFLVLPGLLPLGSALTQERDSTRIGIHRLESESHRWDVLRTHPAVPELKRGNELVRQGDINGAFHMFRRAAYRRAYIAHFNMGIVYFETGKLKQALQYLQRSYRARKDSVCLEYLRNTQRLMKEQPSPR